MFKNVLLLTTTALLFAGCIGESKEEIWHSFIYPDKQNSKRSLKSPITFKSLQECQTESIKQLEILKISDVGTYKCGLNCEYHEGMKIEVCEKMLAAPVK